MPKVDKKSEKRSRNGLTDMQHVDTITQNKLDRLKCLREKVNWEIKGERQVFLKNFGHLIADWKLHLPDLRTIFRQEEINLILSEAYDYHDPDTEKYTGRQIINFIARTGYKDKPTIDMDSRIKWEPATPLHRAATHVFPGSHMVVADLFRIFNRMPINGTDKGDVNHFFVACESGCASIVEKFLRLGQDPNWIPYQTADSALHLAARYGHKTVIEVLLSHGANELSTNASEATPLHVICNRSEDDGMVKVFCDAALKSNRLVQTDVRDNKGRTPLHLAVMRVNPNAVGTLLRKFANPNIADAEGSTILHYLSNPTKYLTGGRKGAKTFRGMSTAIVARIKKMSTHTLDVNAKDNLGNTPLHYALKGCDGPLINLLLKEGANPNLTNNQGLTPLHAFCERKYDNVLNTLLVISKQERKPVQMDIMDGLGRTPLQIAVSNLNPKLFDALLDHGADMNHFVFPNEDQFYQGSTSFEEIEKDIRKSLLVTRIMVVLERLELRGYKLKRSDVLTIGKLFEKIKFFEMLSNHDENQLKEKWFEIEAKKVIMADNLSLYQLIQMPAEDAKKQCTYTVYFNFWRTHALKKTPDPYLEACTARLCNMMMKEFLCHWAAIFSATDGLQPEMQAEEIRICSLFLNCINNE